VTTPPAWAQDLTLKALLWWERQGKTAPLFDLRWRHCNRPRSSGTARIIAPHWIVVRAGKSRLDAKLCLLHEIAHQLTNDGHTPEFWDVAWQLYRWAKLPMRYCIEREQYYRKGAMIAYKKGAK